MATRRVLSFSKARRVDSPMRESRRKVKSGPGPAALVIFLTLLCVLAASERADADLRPPARSRGAPAMRFVRVVSADPACEPNCPEWLSAEGRIEPGSAPAFAEAVNRLGGRRLPILIHSPGGSVTDAIAMGKLIRAKGLAVAVGRTLMQNCSETAPRCPDGPGVAITGGAICASACALVLAGGVERLVGPVPLVGVHQITTVVRETEGLAHLTSTRKFYEQDWADAAVRDYLTAMGVGDPVMALLRKTPAASVHWLSLADLTDSHLATSALDAAQPILTSGVNGLNSRRFEGDPPPPDLLRAGAVEPLALPVAGRSVMLEIAFSYRRGGGAIGVEVTARDADTRQPVDPPASGFSLTLTADRVELLQLKTAGSSPPLTIIPRERFCALAHDGKIVVAPATSPAAGPWADEPPVAFAFAEMEGRTAVVDEACS
jgi:hypothetical protein